MSPEAVDEYAEVLRQGGQFPCVVVFFDGKDYWLADGFHRVAAAKKVGRTEVGCEVRPGTRRDAVLFGAGANATHGLRRTNEDKRRAVTVLLQDQEWAQWSDREIARHCGVSQPFVSKLRVELSDNRYQKTARKVRRAGTTYTMQTGGKGAEAPQDPSGDEEATQPPTPDDILSITCQTCGERVDRAVWHCPACDRHLLAETETCDDCQSPRPAVCRDWVVVGATVYPTPFTVLFPDLEGEDYRKFRQSIQKFGLRDPIIVDERGAVIDGRQRLRVIADLGLAPKVSVRPGLSDTEKLGLALSLNYCRRGFTPERRKKLEWAILREMARITVSNR
jgi:ParB-like chromosome segregation protein Spo0J